MTYGTKTALPQGSKGPVNLGPTIKGKEKRVGLHHPPNFVKGSRCFVRVVVSRNYGSLPVVAPLERNAVRRVRADKIKTITWKASKNLSAIAVINRYGSVAIEE
jgi:hypothetical protein